MVDITDIPLVTKENASIIGEISSSVAAMASTTVPSGEAGAAAQTVGAGSPSNALIEDVRSRFQDVAVTVDLYLHQYPIMTRVAASIGIKPRLLPVAFLILVAMMLGMFDCLISSAVGFVYPAWQSFKAIETPNSSEDKQWLCYWVCYTAFVFVDFLLFWIPYYYVFKVFFLLWLFLPQFKGASIVYVNILRPFLRRYEKNIDNALSNPKQLLNVVQGELRKSQ